MIGLHSKNSKQNLVPENNEKKILENNRMGMPKLRSKQNKSEKEDYVSVCNIRSIDEEICLKQFFKIFLLKLCGQTDNLQFFYFYNEKRE